jgi:hypothetical protein
MPQVFRTWMVERKGKSDEISAIGQFVERAAAQRMCGFDSAVKSQMVGIVTAPELLCGRS